MAFHRNGGPPFYDATWVMLAPAAGPATQVSSWMFWLGEGLWSVTDPPEAFAGTPEVEESPHSPDKHPEVKFHSEALAGGCN